MAKRAWIQAAAALLQNGYLRGFGDGSLYRGPGKQFCVPGLNCYSCPGALAACPIGALQAMAANVRFGLSFYVYGFLLLTGLIGGRLVCGFLCPFGFIQELLYRVPLGKWRRPLPPVLRRLKYAVLLVLVIGIPTALTLTGGISFPAFCQWLCPAGTLEAGIPVALANERIRGALGWLFVWKLSVLLGLLYVAMRLFRPFCRVLCPLGAIYALLNRLSVVHIRTESHCQGCGACRRVCGMEAADPDDPECIRCGRCVTCCPTGARRWAWRRGGAPVRSGEN
ncbi:MAG: 4Fe-4S binding protein [Gracilibacteraceae bacterium]|nr:4Fe-4S binding protein [Gracilibacteraceae bacterium]